MSEKQGPFHAFVDHFGELTRMRQHALHPVAAGGEVRTHATAWIPTTDIFVRGDDLVIRSELAGVAKDDLEVTLSRGTLWIWGERTQPPETEGDVSFYVRERSFGPFRRSTDLPERVDATGARATFADGLLEITIEGVAAPGDVERIAVASEPERDSTVDVTRG
jgi:HSP20 family protein